jgi:hypothetical protein
MEGRGREINYPSFVWILKRVWKLILSCLFIGLKGNALISRLCVSLRGWKGEIGFL